MDKENKNENRDRENAGINYQDSPHHEGAQNNTVPASGQPSSHNTTSSISEMKNVSKEQEAGRDTNKSAEDENKPLFSN